MRIKMFFAVALLAVMVLPFAAEAAPQMGDCGLATYDLAPSSGPAGSTATASGTGALSMGTLDFYWDSSMGAMVGSATADQYGNYTATINIPMDATLGLHNVVMVGNDSQENPIECSRPFTVVAATGEEGEQPDVQSHAYAQAGVLPSTGFMFIAPAAGLLLGGALLAARRRW